jgi:hypothetical protein
MTPKEDQQPMTTREELKPFVWHQLNAYEACNGTLWRTADEAAAESERAHKASRQEVGVGELAGFFVTEFPHLLTMSTQIEVARALLAEYSITKRTTEG